jgi:hypothetical protein
VLKITSNKFKQKKTKPHNILTIGFISMQLIYTEDYCFQAINVADFGAEFNIT